MRVGNSLGICYVPCHLYLNLLRAVQLKLWEGNLRYILNILPHIRVNSKAFQQTRLFLFLTFLLFNPHRIEYLNI